MKKITSLAFIAIIAMFSLSSCQMIGDIFKAGVWSGILLVVAVIAIIIYLISSVSRRK